MTFKMPSTLNLIVDVFRKASICISLASISMASPITLSPKLITSDSTSIGTIFSFFLICSNFCPGLSLTSPPDIRVIKSPISEIVAA